MLKFQYKMKHLDFVAFNSRREDGGENICAVIWDNREETHEI